MSLKLDVNQDSTLCIPNSILLWIWRPYHTYVVDVGAERIGWLTLCRDENYILVSDMVDA